VNRFQPHRTIDRIAVSQAARNPVAGDQTQSQQRAGIALMKLVVAVSERPPGGGVLAAASHPRVFSGWATADNGKTGTCSPTAASTRGWPGTYRGSLRLPSRRSLPVDSRYDAMAANQAVPVRGGQAQAGVPRHPARASGSPFRRAESPGTGQTQPPKCTLPEAMAMYWPYIRTHATQP
jgi:hypothetical protein